MSATPADILRMLVRSLPLTHGDVIECGHAPVCMVPVPHERGLCVLYVLHLCCAACARERLVHD